MSDVINVSCPCNYRGKHYKGFTVHPGVKMDTQPAPCLPSRTQIVFKNAATDEVLTKVPTGIYVEGVTGADIFDQPVAEYFDIRV